MVYIDLTNPGKSCSCVNSDTKPEFVRINLCLPIAKEAFKKSIILIWKSGLIGLFFIMLIMVEVFFLQVMALCENLIPIPSIPLVQITILMSKKQHFQQKPLG